MSENTSENRLPPPAFPPGSRKHVRRSSESTNSAPPKTGSVSDALISPDDPMPERLDAVERAFISPDEPIPERKIELAEAFQDEEPLDPDEEGEVVGMDFDPHTDAAEVIFGADPFVVELVDAVAKLAESIKRRGEAGLRADADMSRFEVTLRAYCVGYLAGRRVEEPAAPEIEEALPTDF